MLSSRYRSKALRMSSFGLAVVIVTLVQAGVLWDFLAFGGFGQGQEGIGQAVAASQDTTSAASVSMDDVLRAAQMAITSSQTAVSSIQTIAALLPIFIAGFGAVSLGVIIWYRRRVERAEDRLYEVADSVEELRGAAGTMKSAVKEMRKREDQIEEALEALRGDKDALIDDLGQVRDLVEVLHGALQVEDPNPDIRMRYLQRLSQAAHPAGILPMVRILKDGEAEERVRAEAASGLGRYSENADLNGYWAQILACFQSVLQDKSLPDRVAVGAILGAMKFGAEAREIFPSVLEWSRQRYLGEPECMIMRSCRDWRRWQRLTLR